MARVMSDTPGRLRIRLRPERRRSDFMQRVHGHLSGRDGIHAVETNPATGSVTVKYDPTRRSTGDVWSMLKDLGVVAESVTDADIPAFKADGENGPSDTAAGIVGAVSDLDERLSRLTGHTIDLKLLFPLGLGALGVAQIASNGLQLAEVPGYVLLWYAFDSFFKLHVQAQRPRAKGEEARGAAHANGRAAHSG